MMRMLDRFSGHRVAISGRLKQRAELETLCEVFGATLGSLDADTTIVVLGARAATKAIEKLRAGGAAIEAVDWEELVEKFSLEPRDLVALLDGQRGAAAIEALVGAFGHDHLPPLSGEDISGCVLTSIDLQLVDLAGSDLRQVKASEARFGLVDEPGQRPVIDMTGGRFDDAELCRARFGCANLAGASFRGANLTGAEFFICNFDGVDFTGADLSNCTIKRVDNWKLGGADLAGATLDGVHYGDFTGEDLGATLCRGYFTSVCFDGASLSLRAGTAFHQCSFVGASIAATARADFSECDLSNADFGQSNLVGADLSTCNLQGAKLAGALLTFVDRGEMGPGRIGPAVEKYLDMLRSLPSSCRGAVRIEGPGAVADLKLSSSKSGEVRTRWSVTSTSIPLSRDGSCSLEDLCRRFSGRGEVRLDTVGHLKYTTPWDAPAEVEDAARAAWAELLGSSTSTEEKPAPIGAGEDGGEEELLDLLDEDPADLDRWRVYADWLLERGDIRGQMIAAELDSVDDSRALHQARRFTKANEEQIIGELSEMRDTTSFGIRHGFVFRLAESRPHEAAERFETLLTHPAARFVRELELISAHETLPDEIHQFVRERPVVALSFRGSSQFDIRALAFHTRLRSLDLREMSIHDVGPLANLINLEILRLRGTSIDSVDVLGGLHALEVLDLGNTAVSSVDALSGLESLEWINLRDTPVTNLDALADIATLRTVCTHRGVKLGRLADRERVKIATRKKDAEHRPSWGMGGAGWR